LNQYFHHSSISQGLFDFAFRFEFWQTFDTPFLSGFVPLKNGPSFRLDSPGLRTRHCQVGVERSSAVPSDYRRKWQKFAFTFVFSARDSKQQMATAII
jgi:hypothetical protein